MDHNRRSAGVGLARICRARSRSSWARWRSSFEGTPLTLPPLRGSFPLPKWGEGLGTGDLPRLAALIQRDKDEFAFRHRRFAVAITLPRNRFRLEAQRSAPL